MTMPDLDSMINERIAWVDDELRAMLRPVEDEPIVYGMLRYHLGWTDPTGEAVGAAAARRFGGKRLRGVLALLAGEACGGEGRALAPAGAAGGLIHNFSLIHAGIEGADEARRHRPAGWRGRGVPQGGRAGSPGAA